MLQSVRLTRRTPSLVYSALRKSSRARPTAGFSSLLARRQPWPPAHKNNLLISHFSSAAWRSQEASAVLSPQTADCVQDENSRFAFAKALPVACPGCGALSQTVENESPGFYSPKRRNARLPRKDKDEEDQVFKEALARLQETESEAAADLTIPGAEDALPDDTKPMLCDRCHHLIYQSKGQSILHPSVESIRSIIEASPHRDNHIYHVLDAADFPMSLIPNLIARLNLPRLRTQNRRSKATQYIQGRQADISFIITRSDLLAPQKEMVDRMMPYLQHVLRDALGRSGHNLRLGNVRCVSAKRGWWTPQVKEEIWKRGGAGWVVGKVNVGKSALFELVYPKGRTISARDKERLQRVRQRGYTHLDAFDKVAAEDRAAAEEALQRAEQLAMPQDDRSTSVAIGDGMLEASESALNTKGNDELSPFVPTGETDMPEEPQQQLEIEEDKEDNTDLDEDYDMLSLLPPPQQEVDYPHMPIVSSLPGTTAAPIRIPFGNGKGELIDLPGVARSSMETHVKPEHHSSLIMKSRIVPEQYTLKPGQSLLLGGFIRITPKTEDLIFLAYPFTPLHAHATGTRKAVAIQTGTDQDGGAYTGTIENIATDKAKQRMTSAGTFKLEWDATKRRTGSLTDKTAGKQKIADLPFIVYSADILIEGVGWVELACQVRSRKKSLISDAFTAELGLQEEPSFPEVEVFTPKGKFIGIRKPMNAWITGGPRKVAKHAQRKRPRMSISYHKRMEGGKMGGQRPALVSE